MSSSPPSPIARRAGLLAALALLLAAPGAARAAVVLDAFVQGSAANSPDLTDIAITVGAGSDRLMVIAVSTADNVMVNAVSFKGVAAQRVFVQLNNQPASPCHTEIWRLVGPPSGAGLVAVTLPMATAFGVGVVTYSGVDQKNPTFVADTATGTTSPVRVTSNVTDGRPIVGVVCMGGSWTMRAGPNAVAGPGDTDVWDFTERNIVGLGSQQASVAGGQVSWDVSFSGTFAWAALALTVTPAPVVVPPPDAAPDVAPDARPDAPPPTDTSTTPDAGRDLAASPPPDAGADAQAEDDAEPDSGEIVSEVDAEVAVDDADPEPPSDAVVAPLPDAETMPLLDGAGMSVRDVNLQVGCACRIDGRGRPGLPLVLLLVPLLVRRRR